MTNIDLYLIIKDMNKRPGLYLGDFNVYNLWSFFNGYRVSKENFTEKEEVFFSNFNSWMAKYYNEESKTKGWAKILIYNTSPYGAYSKFFELYQKWYKEEFEEDAW